MDSPSSSTYSSLPSSSSSSWSAISSEVDLSDQMQKQLQLQQQRYIDLPMSSCSPCSEELLSLAAVTVLSVLQCPPSLPVSRSSSLIFKSPAAVSLPATAVAIMTAATSTMSEAAKEQHVQFLNFLRNVCIKATVTELALVVSLIYVDRLKKVLTNMARGDPDTPFKIILSALLVVKKFIEEDCIGLNRMFSKITDGLYSVHDINTMERSFLGLLKFSLYVTEKDVFSFIQSHQKELQGVEIIKSLSNPAAAA